MGLLLRRTCSPHRVGSDLPGIMWPNGLGRWGWECPALGGWLSCRNWEAKDVQGAAQTLSAGCEAGMEVVH